MSPLLLVSIALLVGSFAATVALWIRSGETRVGLFGALFAALAALQGAELWAHWGEPLVPDASAAAALAGVVISLLGVGVVVALWRTLGERDRAEVLHWDSMETVRTMNEFSSNERMPFEEKVEKLLEMGCARYGLEVGLFSRIHKDRYEVLAVRGPNDFPVARGAVFSLAETFCAHTVDSERPIAVERITDSTWTGRLDRAAFPFETYLGAAVPVAGLAHGTLCFGGRAPRKDRFTATDKDLVRLMAQWLGNEVERREGLHAYVEPAEAAPLTEAAEPETTSPDEQPDAVALADPVPEPEPVVELEPARDETDTADKSKPAAEPEATAVAPPAPPRPQSTRARRVVDVNKILRRFEKDLRNLAGPQVVLQLKLDDQLGMAAVQRVPLDAIARTLVMNARDAMPDGGELVIATANLELTSGEPGVIPAVAPDRYVTIAVRDSGSEPDADTLSRLYEPSVDPDAAPPNVRDPEGRLALSTVYRVLQACGGDLSVDVEPGRGSTFTVYLPRARNEAAQPDTATDAAAPDSPSRLPE